MQYNNEVCSADTAEFTKVNKTIQYNFWGDVTDMAEKITT